ncbi:MAG: hypothetical protein IJW31_08985 [Lentisphaeria bacterium]|nr:hypothetical protein [Lentisphaeria bacterium]
MAVTLTNDFIVISSSFRGEDGDEVAVRGYEFESAIIGINAFKSLKDLYDRNNDDNPDNNIDLSGKTILLTDSKTTIDGEELSDLFANVAAIRSTDPDSNEDVTKAKNTVAINNDYASSMEIIDFLTVELKNSIAEYDISKDHYYTEKNVKDVTTRTYTADGKLTAANTEIHSNIVNYKDVTLTNSSANGIYLDTLSKTEDDKEIHKAVGSLTVKLDKDAYGDITIGGFSETDQPVISGYSKVTMTGLDPKKYPDNVLGINVYNDIVGGDLVGYKEVTTFDEYTGEESTQVVPSYNASGSIDLKNNVMVMGDIKNYSTVKIAGNSNVYNIDKGDNVYTDAKPKLSAAKDDGMGMKYKTESQTRTYKKDGTVTISDSIAGAITNYKTVTLTNAETAGHDITLDSLVSVTKENVLWEDWDGSFVDWSDGANATYIETYKSEGVLNIKNTQTNNLASFNYYGFGNISGYMTVNASGYEAKKDTEYDIHLTLKNIYGGNKVVIKNSMGTISEITTANGTVTLKDNVYMEGGIFNFATVNLTDVNMFNGETAGDINKGANAATTAKPVMSAVKNDYQGMKYKTVSTTTTVKKDGTATIKDSTVGDIVNYKTVNLTDSYADSIILEALASSVERGEVYDWGEGYSEYPEMTYTTETYKADGAVTIKATKDSESGISIGNSNYAMDGSLMDAPSAYPDDFGGHDTTVIGGYSKVSISGYIDKKSDALSKAVNVYGNIVGGDMVIEDEMMHMGNPSYSSGSIDIKDNVSVQGALKYFTTVKVSGNSSVGDIDRGSVSYTDTTKSSAVKTDEMGEKYKVKTLSRNFKKDGTVTITDSTLKYTQYDFDYVGNIFNYKTVNLTNSSAGFIISDALATLEVSRDSHEWEGYPDVFVQDLEMEADTFIYKADGTVTIKADKNAADNLRIGGDPMNVMHDHFAYGYEYEMPTMDYHEAITGYSKVTITGYEDNKDSQNDKSVTIDGSIRGGNKTVSSNIEYGEMETTITASGQVDLKNNILLGGGIYYYTTVNLTDVEMSGDIVKGDNVETVKVAEKVYKGEPQYWDYDWETGKVNKNYWTRDDAVITTTTTTYKNDGKITLTDVEYLDYSISDDPAAWVPEETLNGDIDISNYDNVTLTNSTVGDVKRDTLNKVVTESSEIITVTKDEFGTYEMPMGESYISEVEKTYKSFGTLNFKVDKNGFETAEIIDNNQDPDFDYGYPEYGYPDYGYEDASDAIVDAFDERNSFFKHSIGAISGYNNVTVNGYIAKKDDESSVYVAINGDITGGNIEREESGFEYEDVNPIGYEEEFTASGTVSLDNVELNTVNDDDYIGGEYEEDSEDVALEFYKNKHGIIGFKDVKIKNSIITGDIIGGNSEIESVTTELETVPYIEEISAVGTVNITDNSCLNGNITNYTTVTIKDSHVHGDITKVIAETEKVAAPKLTATGDKEFEPKYNDMGEVIYDKYGNPVNDTNNWQRPAERTTVTTLTYKNDGNLTATNAELENITNYGTVNLTNAHAGDITRDTLEKSVITDKETGTEWQWSDSSGKDNGFNTDYTETTFVDTYKSVGNVTIKLDKNSFENAKEVYEYDYEFGQEFLCGYNYEIGKISGYQNVTVSGYDDPKEDFEVYVQIDSIKGGNETTYGYAMREQADVDMGMPGADLPNISDKYVEKSEKSVAGTLKLTNTQVGTLYDNEEMYVIYGFNTVNVSDSNIYGSVIGVECDLYDITSNSELGTGSTVNKVTDSRKVHRDYSDLMTQTVYASGTLSTTKTVTPATSFTMTDGELAGSVYGYKTITLTEVEKFGSNDSYMPNDFSMGPAYVEKIDVAYKTSKVDLEIDGSKSKADSITETITYSKVYNNSGSITIKDSDLGVVDQYSEFPSVFGNDIMNYSKATITNSNVGNLYNNMLVKTSGKVVTITIPEMSDTVPYENNISNEYKANGSVTIKLDKNAGSDKFVGTIYGYEKVSIAGYDDHKGTEFEVNVLGDITGGAWTESGEAEVYYDEFGNINDFNFISQYDNEITYKAIGTVDITNDVDITGNIYSYDKVTIKNSDVYGAVNAGEIPYDSYTTGTGVIGTSVTLDDAYVNKVANYKSLTMSNDSIVEVIHDVDSVNVSKGYNSIGDYACADTQTSTFTIAANASLEVFEHFGAGKSLTNNGCLIINDYAAYVDNIEYSDIINLENTKYSGNGYIAANETILRGEDREYISRTDDQKIKFLNLGETAQGFVSIAAEKADDTEAKAQVIDDFEDIAGWLGQAYEGYETGNMNDWKLVLDDKVDYFKFTYDGSEINFNPSNNNVEMNIKAIKGDDLTWATYDTDLELKEGATYLVEVRLINENYEGSVSYSFGGMNDMN